MTKLNAFQLGKKAGQRDNWMDCEHTLAETLRDHRKLIRSAADLVGLDQQLWEETDHFRILYGAKLAQGLAKENMIDKYADRLADFWEGYLAERLALGIDIYAIARKLLRKPCPTTQRKHA